MLQKSTELVREDPLLTHPLCESVLRCLLYFDIFKYPLKEDEILFFLDRKATLPNIRAALVDLVEKQFIHQFNEFYSIQNRRENVARRIRGNEVAQNTMRLARQKANLIGRFPFVRSVMVSGSLSKGYMDADSDIDFFVVTEPGRLWIARMLLVLYKRIFLKNSHKHFCVNYFVSTDKLEIEEQNIFTATELATVMPQYNQSTYGDLLKNNGWVTRFLPNFAPRQYAWKKEKQSSFKKVAERFIDVAGGRLLDEWCMQITLRRWSGKYKSQYDDADFQVAFKSKKYASKNHPKNYQKKVTQLLDDRWKEFLARFNGDTL